MHNLWVTGYRSYEMNIFDDKDPKFRIVLKALINHITAAADQGLEWVLTGGQLGTEQWTVQAVQQVKKAYPKLQTAIILPFEAFGDQWQQNNQERLAAVLAQADFTATVSHQPYQSPQQLRNYQTFMMDHTDGALLLYDPEYEGKPKYDHAAILQRQARLDYPLDLIDMYDLEDLSREL